MKNKKIKIDDISEVNFTNNSIEIDIGRACTDLLFHSEILFT